MAVIAGLIGGFLDEDVISLGFVTLFVSYLLLCVTGIMLSPLGDITEIGLIIKISLSALLVIIWALWYGFNAVRIGILTYKRLSPWRAF